VPLKIPIFGKFLVSGRKMAKKRKFTCSCNTKIIFQKSPSLFTIFLSIQHKAQIVIHECPNGKNSRRIDPRADNFQPNFVLRCDHNVLILRLVAGRIAIRTELHIGWDAVMRNEARQWPNFCKHSNLVDLLHDSVEDLAFEGSENDGFVFDGINHKSLAGLNDSTPDVDDCGDGDDEAVLSCAGPFNLGVELLANGVEELRSEVTRVEEDLVLEGYLKSSEWLCD
jgi:hypothetical protein